ncbi:MAG TPA: aspartate 1-decarboxylase, partial [Anaerolineales bacterium]
AKIHGATVTEVNLQYVGSLTLDSEIMEKLDILPNEAVQILNLNNGSRFTTYVIPGEAGSGVVAINGAAARLAQPGDKVLVVSYALMEEKEARSFRPKVAIVDERNRIVEVRQDVAAAPRR